ncbi:Fanconi anemia group M protein isoform X3 [Brienomyrus brachyistius]|uniref:Fanconi anemia group M protein isoform X3 n=1 Tax=Brienomyrus brachyistius TaxID=42636 RepID=UPI0020B2AB68|nr:Fanconi anemia group M protein isoform X3 [Brienomyrus brachyistius]
MSSGNQRTLFQTWGTSLSKRTLKSDGGNQAPGRRKASASTGSGKQHRTANPTSVTHSSSLWGEIGHDVRSAEVAGQQQQEEEDDELMLIAVYEAEKALQDAAYTIEDGNVKVALPNGTSLDDLPGFDSSSAEVWVYPTNYPIREYQLKISEAALFQNTMVCLPTGLGKTFIAAVVMYNFYRWYPSGKIVFMAPTKPLVAQQIEACYKVMGIPQGHMAELTGSTQASSRRELWRARRVFFLTPQVMVNDLSRETCPATQVKCLVIDEAHKALGNHAYCQVVRELMNQTQQFRILALSATPGGDIKAVQQVISNLLISHIELRSEESPDIQAHSHQRSVQKIVVPLGDLLSGYQARYLQVLEKFTSRLTQMGVLSARDLRSLTKYQLILAREQFRNNPHPRIMGAQHGALEGDFALCITLYHGYELLLQMGVRSLFLFIQGIMDGTKEMSRARNELQRTKVFMDLYGEMETMFGKPSAGPEVPFVYSHPKLQKLEEVVLQHFRTSPESSGAGPSSEAVSTRVMIFSSFRESVQEIAIMLNRHQPLIRVMTFMGQATAGKAVRGFTQKEQLEVVRKFREGGFNTLVSTCVGEEGLDIGEVDLIVCFDAQKNPIRLVQRMGRTGRRRQGRIVVILAAGREERTYNQSQCNKRSVYKSITGKQHSLHMYPHSPRMLPAGVQPTLHKMFITCGQFEPQEAGRRSSRGRRSVVEVGESLLHPRVQGGRRHTTKEDGFLSPAELSLWANTMRLGEAEPQPVLSHSHFLFTKSDAPAQENVSVGPVRELSLGEWACWQNQPLPTYRVSHSARCLHFTEVMGLLDSMRQEEQGSSSYELTMRSYLRKEDVVGYIEDGQPGKAPKTTTAPKTVARRDNRDCLAPINILRKSSSRTWLNDEEDHVDFVLQDRVTTEGHRLAGSSGSPWNFRKKMSSENNQRARCETTSNAPLRSLEEIPVNYTEVESHSDCIVICDDEEVSLADGPSVFHQLPKVNSDAGYNSLPEDPSSEIENMFYLPNWGTARKLHSSNEPPEAVRAILANVLELLSRSPPQVIKLTCSKANPMDKPLEAGHKPQQNGNPFQVSFLLGDDLADEESSDSAFSDKHLDGVPLETEKGELNHLDPAEGTCSAVCSPTWDEVFDNDVDMPGPADEVNNCEAPSALPGPVGDREYIAPPKPDESIVLFGEADDDDVFFQIKTLSSPLVSRKAQEEPSLRCVNEATTLNNSARRTIEGDATKSSKDMCCTSPEAHQEPSSSSGNFDCSQELFSVNFDLGFSLEESDEENSEQGDVTNPMAPDCAAPQESRLPTLQENLGKATTFVDLHERNLSSVAPQQEMGQSLVSLLGVPLSPFNTEGPGLSTARAISTSSPLMATPRKAKDKVPTADGCSPCKPASRNGQDSIRRSLLQSGGPVTGELLATPHAGPCGKDSDDEVVAPRRRGKVDPLATPEAKSCSDVDTPVRVTRRRVAVLNTSGESEGERLSDEDFQDISVRHLRAPHCQERSPSQKKVKAIRGREYLVQEAELSDDGGDVSSDEVEDDLDGSLEGFVVNSSHFSQGLNDSEMRGVYLKSIKSPAVLNKFKMAYKAEHNTDIFSQVPEQDETYGEDSFVVQGSEEEELRSSEEEEEEVSMVDLLPEESFIGDRRVYTTRRRVRLRKAREETREEAREEVGSKASRKPKRSRIMHMEDSSDEEVPDKRKKVTANDAAPPCGPLDMTKESVFKTPLGAPSAGPGQPALVHSVMGGASLLERCQQRLNLQASVSEALDFQPVDSTPSRPAESQAGCSRYVMTDGQNGACLGPVGGAAPIQQPLSVLVDSRCIAGGTEVVSCLRRRHGLSAQVCSLGACDFAVSCRLAVDRLTQSEVASSLNRKRLVERVQALQVLFDRVCLILEKDRIKPGDAARPFQPTRYYDSTLAALVRAGVRLLFSGGPEETAGLLAELAHVEQRKGQAITVPTQVEGHKQQALQFYLTLPCVSYVTALHMCHAFRSVGHLVDSSVESLMDRARVSRQRAEEIFRCLRYPCDPDLLPDSVGARKRNL